MASTVWDVILRKTLGIMTAIDEDTEFPYSQDAYVFATMMVEEE